MSWKCVSCGHKLSGKENYCPNCAAKTVFRCVKCGKELDNGKHKLCPICNTKRAEDRNAALKKVGEGVAAAGSVVLAIVTRGKWSGKT